MTAQTQDCRMLPPTLQHVEHALRDLEYSERLVGYAMTASAGNAAKDVYSLREAALFLTGTPWDAPMLNSGFKGALNWVNGRDLVRWLRDAIGDDTLADAIEQDAIGLEPFMAESQKIAELVTERMVQYREVVDAARNSQDEPVTG